MERRGEREGFGERAEGRDVRVLERESEMGESERERRKRGKEGIFSSEYIWREGEKINYE